jgi:ABC-type uncharacterized transport system permease subunit
MSKSPLPPGPVIGAVAISGFVGAFWLLAAVLVGADDGFGYLAIFSLVVAALFGVTAWQLWQGARAAQVGGIVLGVLMAVFGLANPTNPVVLLLVGLGIALVVLLTVPAGSRAYFRRRQHRLV